MTSETVPKERFKGLSSGCSRSEATANGLSCTCEVERKKIPRLPPKITQSQGQQSLGKSLALPPGREVQRDGYAAS